MKRKRILSLLLAGAMVLSLAACGNNSENTSKDDPDPVEQNETPQEEDEQPEEPVEITFPLAETMEFTAFDVMNETYKLAEAPAMIEALERANISIDFTEVTITEAEEKGNLLISGGNYPDMFFKMSMTADLINQYGADGIFIPLENLIREYAPNCAAMLDKMDGWDTMTSPDGHIYSMPYFTEAAIYGGDAPLWINKVWLDELGLEEPKSLEELYDVLKAFKTQDPNGNGEADEIPITFAKETFTPHRFLNYMEEDLVYIDKYLGIEEDGLNFYAMTDTYKTDYLEFLRKLNDEGLMDPESFTQTIEQMQVDGKASNIYGMFFQAATSGMVPDDKRVDYILLKPMGDDTLPIHNGTSIGGAAITDACENPEVLVAWMDYFYTEEGARLASYGIEGVHYQVFDDGTYTTLQDENNMINGELWPMAKVRIQGTTAAPLKLPDIRYFPNIEHAVNPEGARVNAHRLAELNDLYGRGTIMPTLILTEDENKVVATYETDIINYVENYAAQVITRQVDLDATWDEYVQTLKDMKVEEVLAAYNAAYARAMED